MSDLRPSLLTLSGVARGLALAVAGLFLGVAWWHFAPGLKAIGGAAAEPAESHSRIARRMIVYRLSPAQPTVFRFSQPVMQARILTHPVLSPGVNPADDGWVYGIHVELLDGAGDVIAVRDVHSHTRLTSADGSRRGAVQYYRGSREIAAPLDEVRLASPRGIAAVRLSAIASDPGVAGVNVGVSERRPLIDSAAQTAFVRYSRDDRLRLSAPNAFPPEVLTAEERSNIARNQWRPVGPQGIDGRDYRMQVLYEEADGAGGDDAATDERESGG